jgi:transcriptional regulator with XRE-family HTH domain
MGMIKTQREYEQSQKTLEQWQASGEKLRASLEDAGLTPDQGLTQRQLAERLGVNEAQISKDESNEYHGISVERAQRIIDALEGSVTVAVSVDQPDKPAWEPIPAR